jgi:biopolymer transport protein ExbD
MAFSKNNGRPEDSIAEINITPFVDVVLVLLIIFMITAGVVEFGLNIEVPQTREVATTAKDLDTVNITSDGRIFYDDDPISLYDIVPRIKAAQGEHPQIYIRAHKTVPWEVVANVLAECGAAGISPNMITKPMERDPRRR